MSESHSQPTATQVVHDWTVSVSCEATKTMPRVVAIRRSPVSRRPARNATPNPRRFESTTSEADPVGPSSGVRLKTLGPSCVNALRDERLLTVGAGDNVVRFLAPLIVNEAEIDHSIGCLERACAALLATEKKKAAG